LLSFAAWAACTAACAACHKGAEAEKPADALAVKIAAVSRGDVRRLIEAAGPLDAPPGLDVKLGPLVAGRLSVVLVAEGDRVSEGQLLARLDQTPLRDALQQAEAQVAQARAQEINARAKLARAEKAFSAGVAAGQEIDDATLALATATAALRAAEAARSTARNQLGRSELRAPFAGVVAHIFAAPGESLDANKPVVEVARTEILDLRAPLAPALVALVRTGQGAEVRVDGLATRAFPARVLAVSPVIDPATGTALVRVRVPNKDGALKGGAFARARIEADVHRNVLRVPKEALVGSGDAAAVELVVEGKAKKQPVETGYDDDAFVEIVKGLQGGEQVVVQGAYALPDGTPVKAEEKEEPTATGETKPNGAEPKAGGDEAKQPGDPK
jgi:membrane fusion protein (multidrug efflux system)